MQNIQGVFRMKLMDYIFEKRTTIKDFAHDIGYSAVTVSLVLHGKQKPTPRFIYLVNKITQGRVTQIEI